MTSVIGIVCLELERAWRNIRNFAFNNRTIFEILFIVLYSFLQILLIVFVELYPRNIPFMISIFAILVLSVFALHKLLMESRIKLLENNVTNLIIEKESIRAASKKIYKQYFSQLPLTKSLNRRK